MSAKSLSRWDKANAKKKGQRKARNILNLKYQHNTIVMP
jgi:hypothetical protein